MLSACVSLGNFIIFKYFIFWDRQLHQKLNFIIWNALQKNIKEVFKYNFFSLLDTRKINIRKKKERSKRYLYHSHKYLESIIISVA